MDLSKRTIILIGTSLLWGAGTKDHNYLNKILSKKGINVINTSLSGQPLSANLSFALYVLNKIKNKVTNKIEIYLIHSPRGSFYYHNENHVNFLAGPEICQKHLERCGKTELFKNVATKIPNLFVNLRNQIYENINCVIGLKFIKNIIFDRNFKCPLVFNKVGREIEKIKDKNYIKNEIKLFESEVEGDWLKNYVNLGYFNSSLESFKNTILEIGLGTKAKINVMKIPEHGYFYSDVKSSIVERYSKILIKGMKDLNKTFPNISFSFFDEFDEFDYHDHTHLNEKGIEKLAQAILLNKGPE